MWKNPVETKLHFLSLSLLHEFWESWRCLPIIIIVIVHDMKMNGNYNQWIKQHFIFSTEWRSSKIGEGLFARWILLKFYDKFNSLRTMCIRTCNFLEKIKNLNCIALHCHIDIKNNLGRRSGAVDRAVASDTKVPGFRSSHWYILLWTYWLFTLWKRTGK